CKREKALKQVRYQPLYQYRPDLAPGRRAIFEKGLSIRPEQRDEALSAFLYDLKHPDLKFKKSVSRPMLEKHPVTFCKFCIAILSLLLLGVFALYFSQ